MGIFSTEVLCPGHGVPLPAWLREPSFHSSRLRTPPASSVPSSRIHRPGWWPSQCLLWSPGDPRAGVNIQCSVPKPLEGHSRTPVRLVHVCTFTPPGDSSAALPLPHPVIQPSALQQLQSHLVFPLEDPGHGTSAQAARCRIYLDSDVDAHFPCSIFSTGYKAAACVPALILFSNPPFISLAIC